MSEFRSDLFKTANDKTSFIVEFCDSSTRNLPNPVKTYTKVTFTLVLLTPEKKATKTVRYFMDIPAVKCLMYDLFHGKLGDREVKGFKKSDTGERSISIKRVPEKPLLRIGVSEVKTETKVRDSLYFDLNGDLTRQLAITVLDFLKNYELLKLEKTWDEHFRTNTRVASSSESPSEN